MRQCTRWAARARDAAGAHLLERQQRLRGPPVGVVRQVVCDFANLRVAARVSKPGDAPAGAPPCDPRVPLLVRGRAVPAGRARRGATHQARKRQLADQQVGALLELADLLERTRAWPVAERLARLGGTRGAGSGRSCTRSAGGACVSALRRRAAREIGSQVKQARPITARCAPRQARGAPGRGERGPGHARAHPASCVASSWASAARRPGPNERGASAPGRGREARKRHGARRAAPARTSVDLRRAMARRYPQQNALSATGSPRREAR